MKEKNRIYFKLLRKMFAIVFATLVSFTNVIAQESSITISGVVNDASDGSSIPGASVYVEGTNEGTITNVNGEFSLDVPGEEATIVVSFIGYSNYTFTVGDQREFEIEMVSETQELDDVVVIGYGTAKKSDLTGSVGVVDSEDLNQTPNSDFTQALQGRASGVTVTQSGNPGESAKVRIRGVGSINRDSDPIYVIDGVINNNLGSVAPSDIESMQVLKDASAAAIYGADGSNGVVIIETKRGEAGETKVHYSGYGRVNVKPEQFDVMNADEYAEFYNTVDERFAGEDTYPRTAYSDEFRQFYYGEGWQEGTNWQDEVMRNSFSQNHNLRISGGGENSNFSFSMNYTDEEGVLVGTESQKYSARLNSDFNLGEYIKIGESVSFYRREKLDNGNTVSEHAVISSPLMKVYNEENKEGFAGPRELIEYEGEEVQNTGFNDKHNPLVARVVPDNMHYNNNLMGNVFVEVKPASWLTLKTNPSVIINYNRNRLWTPSYESGVRSAPNASLSEEYNHGVNLTMENQVTFNNEYGGHNITATAVHTVRDNKWNTINGNSSDFPWEYLNTFSNSIEDKRTLLGSLGTFRSESYLGRLMYDYNSKYLLTASIRKDGNSRFGPDNRWGTFPSMSAAWRLSDDFLQGVDQISMLKLRTGWGRTGNSDIGSFNYQSQLSTFEWFSPVFGENQQVADALNVLAHFGNPLIKWESAEMLNFGIDLNMYNNKLQLSGEYYIKDMNDQLVKKPMSTAFGRKSGPGDPWINLGEVTNTGIELTGIYKGRGGLLDYDVTANFTTVKNEVNYLPDPILEENNITQIGNSIGSFYGYVAERIITEDDFDPETGEYLYPADNDVAPGDLKYKDLNNDGKITDLDRTVIGKAIPDMNYSLNVQLYYRNWDFSVFVYGMQNFDIYNHRYVTLTTFNTQDKHHNKLSEYGANYYWEENPSTKFVRIDPDNTNNNDRPSSWFLEDGSFVRLKDVQLGYSLPDNVNNLLGIGSARVYATASNLVTLTGYSGYDPESPISGGDPLAPGNDNGAYPLPRAFNIGVQVDF